MKTQLAVAALFAFSIFGVHGQTGVPSEAEAVTPADQARDTYSVAERGAHHRVWERVASEPDPTGTNVAKAHQYFELETGMHYWENGRWIESQELIESYPGGAIARHGGHKVIFANNLNTAGAVDLEMPDGQRMRSEVLGLSYFDAATGQSVLIAELKDSVGLLLPPNQIIYPDAFTNLNADVRYTYRKSGLEQDIILREQPPSPAMWGLNPATSRLQILTEFVDAPVPQKRIAQVKGNPALVDETLHFGAMRIGRGKAFSTGSENETGRGVRVLKQWTVLDGRTFLVEEVPFTAVESELNALPARRVASVVKPQMGKGRNVIAALGKSLPRIAANRNASPVHVAKFDRLTRPGYVLDYEVVSGATNFCFKGDTTYYCTNAVNLYGTTTLEGGAVVKFSTNTSAKIVSWDDVACQTATYRLAVFTAKDDNTVGEAISGSTGSPVGYYGGAALVLTYGFGSDTTPLNNVRFAYQRLGLDGWLATGYQLPKSFSDLQFVKCQIAFNSYAYDFSFQNCLFYDNGTNFFGPGYFIGEHLTFNRCDKLFVDWLTEEPNGSTLKLTNCLGVLITNWGINYTLTTNSSAIFTNDPGVFQSVGAGYHYLFDDTYRNVGRTNISTNLLAALKFKTTYPPVVLSNTVSYSVTLAPQAGRDTDIPDLGYHYEPIDYLENPYFAVSNATVTVTGGAVIAAVNSSVGLWLQDSSAIVSTGTPLAPNWFVRYSSAQEQPLALGTSSPSALNAVLPAIYGSVRPSGEFHFTHFACPADGGYHIWHDQTSFSFTNLLVQDCEFWSGQNDFAGPFNPATSVATIKNNLFHRSRLLATGNSTNATLSFSNNLVVAASATLTQPSGGLWHAHNNAFDACAVSSGKPKITNSHNAYINCPSRLTPNSASDVVLTNFTYTNGTLGNYYQVSTDLIELGSATADLTGLYHYTTQTNQVKETNSIVDIGLHYVAVDGNGNPLDTDGDGTPDYQEDGNGNGNVNSGETDWNDPNDLGLKVWITRPRNNSQIP